MAKLYSTEAAVSATRVATQVFGGAGFIEDSPVARFYRDAKILEIGEGTSEIQRLVIARGLGFRSTDGEPDELGVRRERRDPTPRSLPRRPTRLAGRQKQAGGASKLPGRLLVDRREPFVEDGLLANALAAGPARRRRGHRHAAWSTAGRSCVMANDPTVKAGSWGARTVEKIVRTTEHALAQRAAGLLPGRLGRRPHHRPGRAVPGPARAPGGSSTTRSSCRARCPQICCLFGPSAAGGAYIPAFCDVVIMVEGNASMYLGSPRMAEMVIGEKVTLEEMGGARMHATVSGCGDNLAVDDADAIDAGPAACSPTCPGSWRERPAGSPGRGAAAGR